MSGTRFTPLEGGCACGAVRYRIERPPLIVHCCHCHACQREIGSAFAVNMLIEAGAFSLLQGEMRRVPVPTESGNPHAYHRCRICEAPVWHEYSSGPVLRFVPAGTLDAGHGIEPDIHIFTESKQPWVTIPDGALSKERFYSFSEVWPAPHLERLKTALTAAKET